MKIFTKKKYTILSTISKYTFVFIIAFSLLMPFVLVRAFTCSDGSTVVNSADCPKPDVSNANKSDVKNANTSTIKITGISNPLGSKLNTIPDFIKAILNIVLVIGVPIITLAIIYAGFLFVTAQGNSEKLGAAKTTLLYTLIGAALLLGAFVIANAIKGTVEEIKNTQ